MSFMAFSFRINTQRLNYKNLDLCERTKQPLLDSFLNLKLQSSEKVDFMKRYGIQHISNEEILINTVINTIKHSQMYKQNEKKSRKLSNSRRSEDNLLSDNEQLYSSEDQIQVPAQNPTNEAIYNKYQKDRQKLRSVIKELDQQNQNQPAHSNHFKFRIKNLDTGQSLDIQNQEMEQQVEKTLSQGRHYLENFRISWNDFWLQVNQNNEKLRQYCQEGQYEQAKNLLQKGQGNYPTLINHKALDNWSPIHFACYEGNDDLVELLCQHEADVNAVTKFNRNGLHIAALRGHIQVIKVLFKCKIDADACDNDGNTALHFAAENKYRQIIVFLLESKCEIKKNAQGLTPIHDCSDQSLKKIFYEYGFKEDGDYVKYLKDKLIKSQNTFINKIQRGLINSSGINIQDFVFHAKLGEGSFGEVYLCHKMGDSSKKLFAMKILSKDKLLDRDLKRYALTQRNVMSVINHPFMVKLHYAFQSSAKLFLVMDYYPGGDLGKLIKRRKAIPEDQARNYVSELILAIQALHKNMIVFRDLKPDNVVLDGSGHCILTDFGLSKEGIYNNKTGSFCGSVAYLAPQILIKQGHSRTVDWYLVGILLYELIVGLPPYYNSKKEVLFDNIKRGPLKVPNNMSTQVKDLIKKLLCRDPRKRLGAHKDSQQLKQHQFFKDINWQDVINRKLKMPPIQEPKWDLDETIKISFSNSLPGGKIEGWTFIGQH